jgi:hypothetical protein
MFEHSLLILLLISIGTKIDKIFTSRPQVVENPRLLGAIAWTGNPSASHPQLMSRCRNCFRSTRTSANPAVETT